MRILMLTDYFHPYVGGGVEKVVYEIAKRLSRMGCEVNVATLGRNTMGFYIVDGIKVYSLPSMDLTRIFNLQLALPKKIDNSLRLVKDISPDVVHAHNIFFTTSLLGVLVKILYKRKLVLTAHLGSLQNLALTGYVKAFAVACYERFVGRIMFAASDAITAVSRSVQNHVVALGASPEKTFLIPNGVDIEEFQPAFSNYNNGYVDVISVGRLLPNKGFEYLVEAANLVVAKKPVGVKFRIVGEGPHKKYLEDLVRSKGLTRYFEFMGKVPRVSDVLKEGGIFVRPSLTEGMPLTVLEAMASQLPIIATRVAGTPELIVHNETGLLVEPGNAHQLAEAILFLSNSPEFAEKLGKNAREFIERAYKQQYSWDAVARKYLSLYRSLW
ncbi:MAG: glycosyltransferase family 4 protein [Candidatus Baldrarchaeia archaeon]